MQLDSRAEDPGLEARGSWDRNVDRSRGPKYFLVVGIDAEVDKLAGQIVAPMLQKQCKIQYTNFGPHFGPHFGPQFGPQFGPNFGLR